MISHLTWRRPKNQRHLFLKPHLQPATYFEDFESGELKAWASYPPNQDTAYDPYIYPGKIRPEDPGKCLVVKCEPLWNEDQTLGAVKLLDIILAPGASLRFRYFVKTTNRCPELCVHLPTFDGRRIVYRKYNPPLNRWSGLSLSWKDLEAEGLVGASLDELHLAAVAVTVEVSKGDPDIPIFLGIDDFEINGLRPRLFEFQEPRVLSLAEWPEKIALLHHRHGGKFRLVGKLDFSCDEVRLAVSPFAERNRTILSSLLIGDKSQTWKTEEIVLDAEKFPSGLYRGTITARGKGRILTETTFVFLIESPGQKWFHPRLLCAADDLKAFQARLASARFRPILDRFLSRAKSYRERVQPARIVHDIDQFPDRDWVASLPAWYRDRFMTFREALFTNSVTFISGQDEEAGPFVKALLIRLAAWPRWNHPWMEARGFHTYYPIGEFADAYALAYDTVYDLMTDPERRAVRDGLLQNYVISAFKTYVEQNQITSNSSNWISHIAGGALVALMAVLHDDPELADCEPWLTGFLLKEHKYITTVFGPDGSYGEGFRYYNFAMQSFARTLPSLRRLLGIDFTGPVVGSHQETLWASIVPKNISFSFGDTESYLKQEAQAWWIGTENGPMNSWAWLLEKTGDHSLAWLYSGLKEFDTLQEVLYETGDISPVDPSALGGVRFFPDVGTAVFKSGWGDDDFIFVFRSGPFFNHQHLDQGSFYLADRGEIFLEERYDGEHHYYDDPVYRSHAIQPISHNTILINRNPQSQRVGDPKGFAQGLNDQARLSRQVSAEAFAFVSGDLEPVYRGKIKKLRRNVLYIKPRTILIVDEAWPGEKDVEVNLLFHTRRKKDIAVEPDVVNFNKDRAVLYLYPLLPRSPLREVVSEPHFLCQYNVQPLIERGYLRISAETGGRKLVLANLLAAAKKGSGAPAIEISPSEDSTALRAVTENGEISLAVSSGDSVNLNDYTSDGLILALSPGGSIFAADATHISRQRFKLWEAKDRFIGEISFQESKISGRVRFESPSVVTVKTASRPVEVKTNSRRRKDFAYDHQSGTLSLLFPAGESALEIILKE